MPAPRAAAVVRSALQPARSFRRLPGPSRRFQRASSTAGSEEAQKAASSSSGSGVALKVVGVGAVAIGAGVAYAWQTGLIGNNQAAATPSKAKPKADDVQKNVEKAAKTVPAVDPELAKKAKAEKEATEARAAEAAEAAAAKAAAAEEEAARTKELAELQQRNLELAEEARLASITKREVAEANLRRAMEAEYSDLSLRVKALGEALDQAKAAGVAASKDVLLAEALVRAEVRAEDALSPERLLQLPEEFHGLDEVQARAVEAAHCENLSREQLEARVVELTRLLAMARLHATARVDQALMTQLEAADAASLRSLREALVSAEEEYNKAAEVECKALEEELLQKQKDEVEQAIAAARGEATAALEAEREKLETAAAEAVLEVRAERLGDVISLSTGLKSLEKVLLEDDAVVQRARAYNSLSAALICLEDAILAGGGAQAELEALRKASAEVNDAFVTEVLTSLPSSAVNLCRRAAPVPTELLLRQSLSENLGDLAAAAFVPPNSGLLGEVVGRVFRQFYVLGGEPVTTEDSEAAGNLAALGRAQRASAAGSGVQLREALQNLETSLKGSCRARAGVAWLSEARAALELRQTLSAVKARVQCLNATLC
mmetsp:Transcript_23266/g.42038  ORF Transcript_23266/g.42038 Transcript_23266/m.42038 type:complete len:607 (-) Transcript_23266:78-1898(-)